MGFLNKTQCFSSLSTIKIKAKLSCKIQILFLLRQNADPSNLSNVLSLWIMNCWKITGFVKFLELMVDCLHLVENLSLCNYVILSVPVVTSSQDALNLS